MEQSTIQRAIWISEVVYFLEHPSSVEKRQMSAHLRLWGYLLVVSEGCVRVCKQRGESHGSLNHPMLLLVPPFTYGTLHVRDFVPLQGGYDVVADGSESFEAVRQVQSRIFCLLCSSTKTYYRVSLNCFAIAIFSQWQRDNLLNPCCYVWPGTCMHLMQFLITAYTKGCSPVFEFKCLVVYQKRSVLV